MSSSAQLSLLPWLLRWAPATDRTGFAAGLHAGSSVGLAVALRSDLAALDRRTAGGLALATVPAALVGVLAQDHVERRLGGPGPTALALAAAGALLWAADRRPEDRPVSAGALSAAAAAQVAALVPGVSRSGATLTALRLARVPRAEALRTSMLLSLPVTAGAALLTSVQAGRGPALLPSALSGASAWAAWHAVRSAPPRLLPASAVYRLALAGAVTRRLRQESAQPAACLGSVR